MEKTVPLNNPHMWISNHGPEPFDEVCALCGVFSGAHHKLPDPAAASLPCPEPWPDAPELTEEEMAERERKLDGPVLVELRRNK
jgi:hypothetical protein